MSAYSRGADFERKVRDHLLAQGAKLVIRSAGSRSAVDLVAFWQPSMSGHATAVLVQVKRDGRLTQQAREALKATAAGLGVTAALACSVRQGRRQEVTLEWL